MKHCPHCQILTHDNYQNCPLCDNMLVPDTNTKSATNANKHPTMTLHTFLQPKVVKICRIIIVALMVAGLLSVLLNFAVFSRTIWASYVIVGIVIIVVCGIMPLVNNYPAYKQTKLFLLVVTFVSIVTELTATNFNLPNNTLFTILPNVYLAITLFVDIQLLSNRHASIEWIGTLLHSTIYCIMPQLVMLIMQNTVQSTQIYNTMSVILVCIFAICNAVALFFAKFDYFRQYFVRNFFV